MRKGRRIFALLGKPTPAGITAFAREDITTSWALTAEFGCLRLERLTGEEELTGDHMFLPTSLSYEYGISGPNESPEVTRVVFGILPAELDKLVTVMRRGSFPVLGFAANDLKCSVSSCVIPAYWPHVVTSNLALYGNTVSLESFVRILVASLPQGQLGVRFPSLQPVFKEMMRLMVWQRRGLPYSKEMLELAPSATLAAK